VSNFVAGSITGCPKTSSLENPPYVPGMWYCYYGSNRINNSILYNTEFSANEWYDLANLSHIVMDADTDNQ